jgi:hypothetical protein
LPRPPLPAEDAARFPPGRPGRRPPAQQIAKTFAFAAVLDGGPTAPSAGFLDDGYYGPLGLGATVALDLFARILTRPEPGWFCDTERDDCPNFTPYGTDPYVFMPDSTPLPAYTQYNFQVGLGDGRYLHNDFDYSKGYWWTEPQASARRGHLPCAVTSLRRARAADHPL